MDEPMETIAISKFKATCLAVLERVQRTAGDWLGSLQPHGRVTGEIIEPIVSAAEWEALRP